MKRIAVFVLIVAMTVAAPAARESGELSVMTRNQYLGADLTPILSATTPAGFVMAVQTALSQIAATNFPERAQAFADEIAERRPHLIGLQEAFSFTLNGVTGAPPFRDQLADLLDALAERGLPYYPAAQVRNLTVTIPLAGGSVLQATDRDIILARSDVATWPVAIPGCRMSMDGCNYQVIAVVPSPVGPINIERGFVAVDAAAEGQIVRFVNTHLEIPELPVVIQAAQAAELIARLRATPNPLDLPVIVVGDINSAPTDQPFSFNGQTIIPPYLQFRSAGYLDAWTLRPGSPPGATCCQANDLLNAESLLHKRVDVIFTNAATTAVHANVIGADPEDRTSSGLWPSDHAGVVARLLFGNQ